MAMALWGGALADRYDRRLLLAVQVGLVAGASALAAVTLAGSPAIAVLFALAGVMAGFGAFQGVIASAIAPNVVRPSSCAARSRDLRRAQPDDGHRPGGRRRADRRARGGAAYVLDAASCLAMIGAAFALSPQHPRTGASERRRGAARRPVLDRRGPALRGGNRALMGSFVVDLCAMTFGMPRALFPVLAISVYHAGASGTARCSPPSRRALRPRH
jgi:hypothetical protein